MNRFYAPIGVANSRHSRPALDATIAAQETTLNTQIYRLYRLSPEEIATVEAG
jgi:hypothetical protein